MATILWAIQTAQEEGDPIEIRAEGIKEERKVCSADLDGACGNSLPQIRILLIRGEDKTIRAGVSTRASSSFVHGDFCGNLRQYAWNARVAVATKQKRNRVSIGDDVSHSVNP